MRCGDDLRQITYAASQHSCTGRAVTGIAAAIEAKLARNAGADDRGGASVDAGKVQNNRLFAQDRLFDVVGVGRGCGGDQNSIDPVG